MTASRPDKLITIDDELTWSRRVVAEESSKRYAIEFRGRYVGNISLTDIVDRTAAFHIFIGERSLHGQGIGRAALTQIIVIARNELQLTRLSLDVDQKNLGAIHIYSEAGFKLREPVKGIDLLRMVLELQIGAN